jgi:glycerol-3-phosphate acyltransferase PlsY
LTFAGIVVFGYLMGSCPWGYWLVRVFHHADIRKLGSGSIGASNVWRAVGPKLGVTVVLLDVLKGFLPAFVGVHEVSHFCGILAGAAAMAGHARPLFLRFEKGGKMVATGGGVVIAIAPLVALPLAVLWIAIFALFRYPSVASIVTAVALPFVAVAFGYPEVVVAFSVAAAAAIVFLHRGNLRRLRAGTEHRVRLRGAARLT